MYVPAGRYGMWLYIHFRIFDWLLVRISGGGSLLSVTVAAVVIELTITLTNDNIGVNHSKSNGNSENISKLIKIQNNYMNKHTQHILANPPHDDVITWKHFPRYWPFVREIHRSPVNSPHKGQWRGASMFSLICVWINGWVNNREAGDLRRYRAHYCHCNDTCHYTVSVDFTQQTQGVLTHGGTNKTAAIFADSIQMRFLGTLYLYFYLNFTDMCSLRFNR